MLTRLLENWPYKLAALIIAILLKIYVAGIDDPHATKQFNVPITLDHIPNSLVVIDSTPSVAVQVSGPQSDLENLSAAGFRATIDLRTAHAGIDQALPIHLAPDAGTSQDVTIENQSPHTGVATMEVKSHGRFNVHTTFNRVAPSGYSYGQVAVMPPVATVEGPQSAVNRVARLLISADDAVSGENAGGNLDGVGNIVAVDAEQEPINNLTIVPQQAEIRIPVRSEAATKELIVNATVNGYPTYPAQVVGIDASPDRISVVGSPDQLALANVVQTAAVDITGATTDITKEVKVVVPVGLTLAHAQTIKVTVHIRGGVVQSRPQPHQLL